MLQVVQGYAGRCLVLLLLALFLNGVQAREVDIGLPPFPQGVIQDSEEVDEATVRVFTSNIREVQGEVRANSEIRRELSGKRRLIAIDRHYSVRDAEEHYRAQLKEREATILYDCSGRSCGSSNVWANQVFGQRSLYGRDEEQVYLVSAWRDSLNRIQLNTLYLIQRSNRNIYAYEQAFRLPEGERLSGVELEDRRVFGPVVIRWENPESPSMRASSEDYRRVIEMTNEHEGGTLYLVGFSPLDQGSLAEVMEQTERAVGILRNVLNDRGVSSGRMESLVVGPLVPTAEAGRVGRRIEVMLVREEENGRTE